MHLDYCKVMKCLFQSRHLEVCGEPHGQTKGLLVEILWSDETKCFLATMSRQMFGGVKVSCSNPRTLYLLLSILVVASCSDAVLHCTKETEQSKENTTSSV